MRLFFASVLIVLSGSLYAQTAKVTSLGPEGGIVTLLKGTPNDSVVLAVIREHDLYRSTNGGEKWDSVFSLPQFLSQYSIRDIAFCPSSDTVLMATSIGFFRSEDNGVSWTQIFTYPFPKFCVRYAPANPAIIFGSDEQGVLMSTDGGDTWQTRTDDVIGYRSIRRIAIHPGDADMNKLRIVATTEFHDAEGIFLTTDGGTSWQPFVDGLPDGDARRIYTVEIDSTGLGKTDYRVVIGSANGIYGLQTDQFNGTWQAIRGNNIKIDGVVTTGQLVYNGYNPLVGHQFDFFVAANGSEIDGAPKLYGANNGVFKISSQLGFISSFSPVTSLFNKLCDISSVFIPAQNKNKIYIGTSAGIFISPNDGQQWLQKNEGISRTIIRNLVSISNQGLNNSLFAGTFGGGVLRSEDDGIQWAFSNTGLSNPYVTTVAADDKRNILYAGTVYTIFKSTDVGKTWQPIFAVDPEKVDSSVFVARENDMTIRISPKNPDFIMFYCRAYGLYLSTNGGLNWYQKPIPSGLGPIHVPECIEFDPIDSLTIYFAGKGFHKSTIFATDDWVDFSSNLPKTIDGQVSIQTLSPTINPNNNQEIFLSSVYDVEYGLPYSLWKSTNGGSSWDSLLYPLPSYDVIYDKSNSKRLLASGPYGVFSSTDGGSFWMPLFIDPQLFNRYFLLSTHHSNPNMFYLGSEKGGYRIELEGQSHLTIDAFEYNFGSVIVGKDSVQTVHFRNTNGLQNVIIQYAGSTDDASFDYLGEEIFEVPAGGEVSFDVRFSPNSVGPKINLLTFLTSDRRFDSVKIVLSGYGLRRPVIEKLTVEFGTITVGKDSVIGIEIDNRFGQKPITISYLGNTDSVSFSFLGANEIIVDTGRIGSVPIRFAPRNTGSMQTYMRFATTDSLLPEMVLRIQGKGIARNFISRRILFDTTDGFLSHSGTFTKDHFKLLAMSLERANIKVDYKQEVPSTSYNAMVFVLPNGAPPSDIVDTLQSYIVNGGTVVLLGDYGSDNDLPFNTFLSDSVWNKFSVRTGIKFNSDEIIDESITDTSLAGLSIAYPALENVLTYNVDSLVLYRSGSLSVDTTGSNALPLFIVKTKDFSTSTSSDSSQTLNTDKVIAALTPIKKGKIIAVADYDIWWDGIPEDTTKPIGIFGAKNLRLALNIFGLIDNLAAQLPEQTPKEAYKLFSIPYSFEDSSVLALFKDLGVPNEYIWRMFGKWNDRRGYAEFPKDFKMIRRGEGYWLITKEQKDINFGNASVQGSEADFEIILQPGYNMIGNPFPYRVSWVESFREDSVERVLWRYNKEFDTTSTYMEPFEGYFIKNRGLLPKTIRINSNQVSTSGTTTVPKSQNASYSFSPQEWKLQLIAQTPHAEDVQNYIGMMNASSDGVDKEDFSEPPPAPSDFVSLSIKNSKERLAADYRSVSTDGQYWDMEIMSSKPKVPVTISLNKFGNFSNDFKLYVLDKSEERMIDVTTSLTHMFSLGKKEYARQFRLIAGTQSYIENNTNGIPLVPYEYSLDQNFPNPFNPTTSIRYTLSHTANVKLEIFNILGQTVRSLVHQVQPIGMYTVQWDGTDDLKKKVASGFYYYRLQANEFTNVKKMTLIK